MKKRFLLIILIILLITLTSCKDNKEIHEVSFVSSIGLDYNIDTEEYNIILYFINTINNVSVDYGLSEPELLGFTAEGKGKTINEALIKVQTFSETHLNLKHLESVIFTTEEILNSFSGHTLTSTSGSSSVWGILSA